MVVVCLKCSGFDRLKFISVEMSCNFISAEEIEEGQVTAL
jgi:hypothetical protein